MTKGAKVAYIRVSAIDQNEERQLEAMKPYSIDRFYVEKASAKDTNRPELQTMIDFVREGDTIYVKDFSRLARSTKDLLDIVETLERKGVKLISLKENLDTNTSTGKLMLTLIGAIYEFERANLLERQKEGILIAKNKGKYKGRKKIITPENWQDVYSRWVKREITGKAAMRELKLKPNTFYKMISEQQEQENAAK